MMNRSYCITCKKEFNLEYRLYRHLQQEHKEMVPGYLLAYSRKIAQYSVECIHHMKKDDLKDAQIWLQNLVERIEEFERGITNANASND